MVAEALSRRAVSAPIYEVYLRMIVVSLDLEMIRDAQSEAIKDENRKNKRVAGQILSFDINSIRLLPLYGWV